MKLEGPQVGFERRIRDVASRAVAHLKRGDGVSLLASGGERVRATASVGADPLLRFLALLDPLPEAPKATEKHHKLGTSA